MPGLRGAQRPGEGAAGGWGGEGTPRLTRGPPCPCPCSIEGGELFERIVDDDYHLTEVDCMVFVRQICEGIRFMHHMRVLHLDLKVRGRGAGGSRCSWWWGDSPRELGSDRGVPLPAAREHPLRRRHRAHGEDHRLRAGSKVPCSPSPCYPAARGGGQPVTLPLNPPVPATGTTPRRS